MKNLMNRAKNLQKKIVGGAKAFWHDESGMGTVEVILIIVEIFTLQYISFYVILHNVVLNH